MPRHDEPFMQPQMDPREQEIAEQADDGACPRCFAELGRADPMCPACGAEEDQLHAA